MANESNWIISEENSRAIILFIARERLEWKKGLKSNVRNPGVICFIVFDKQYNKLSETGPLLFKRFIMFIFAACN